MIHKMKLLEKEFNNIKYNNKIIEVRLNDKKRRKINIGDKILFYKLPKLKESILVDIKDIYKFSTFKEVYDKFPQRYFGYKNLTKEQILNNIYSIYSIKEEMENGVVAIKFKLYNDNDAI
ncbi:hypothetical protein N493_07460 [Clostridium botulinum B2 433]|uniref:ASCH domain-containing protein n=1 Tax=Clostridium botulinum TaxID=1491 RepID=UPI0007DFA156|nr:ASCH domain-containing protein [Clostridium botulinum]KEI89335.1 hypothetical protein N493_07460 [Clostridium botulinum B2 433]